MEFVLVSFIHDDEEHPFCPEARFSSIDEVMKYCTEEAFVKRLFDHSNMYHIEYYNEGIDKVTLNFKQDDSTPLGYACSIHSFDNKLHVEVNDLAYALKIITLLFEPLPSKEASLADDELPF